MKENFDKIMEFIFSCEGGYENDENDPSGETNLGISKKAFPNEDIPNMTKERAKVLYRENYWNVLKLDTVEYPWDLILMDTGVNMGCGAAKQLYGKSQNWLDFLMYRIEYYSRLPGARHYLRGWVNRVINLCNLIRSELKHDII